MERYCPALLTIEESRKSYGSDYGRTYHRISRTTRGSRYYGLEFIGSSRNYLVNLQLRFARLFIHTRVPNFPLALIHNPFAHNFYCGVFAFKTFKENRTDGRAKAYDCKSLLIFFSDFADAFMAASRRTGIFFRKSTSRTMVPTASEIRSSLQRHKQERIVA